VKAIVLLAMACISMAAHAAPAFLIEAELTPSTVYTGGEAILRLRLLRAPALPYGVLRPPALGDAADLWPLERVRWYETKREGVTWQVHERTYLVLPRRAGRLELPGAELEGPLRHALAAADKNRKPAADALRGPKVRLEVRAPPPDAAEPWLPARNLTLEERWSRDPAKLEGATVTRTIVVRVEGLPAKRLPALQAFAHEALRVHPDQPELFTEHRDTGTIARMVQRVVLVPLDEAEVVLPELSVRWWDVVADAPRVASLPARTLRLQAAAPEPPTRPAPEPLLDTDALLRVAATAFAFLLVGWLWWRARTQSQREARSKLRKACRENDPRAARDALLEWRSGIEPDRPGTPVPRIGEAWSADARAELRALDAALYGRRKWDGRRFWRRVRPWLRSRPKGEGAHSRAAPFFRLQAANSGFRPVPPAASVARELR